MTAQQVVRTDDGEEVKALITSRFDAIYVIIFASVCGLLSFFLPNIQ